uniref:EOG090X0EEU n=1 Tax=Lynceus sp. MCZ IZ 141354 TaxID=1930659 RepID=A0A9N6WW75_9CRUS|nr:EOG090X0EEU [Lynceus sp. MCZ IZ 141354]
MTDAIVLLLLSFVMLVGSYIVGNIPLMFSMSEEKLHLVSVLGAGLLVGAALTVIIPEGIQMLFSSQIHQENKGTDKPGEHHDDHGDLHTLIGFALVFGFIFMLLVDQIGSLKSFSDVESGVRSQKSFTATLGLVVHSAADGIALGAAATSSHASVEMIVFLAIMLHKAPAAFGLVTYLMHEGLERSKVRKHLLAFSISAPLLAVITYFGLSPQSRDTLSDFNATGFAMLFSAGTFLYVATVHVLPEVAMKSHHGAEKIGFTRGELLALITGALSPLLLTAFHHH